MFGAKKVSLILISIESDRARALWKRVFEGDKVEDKLDFDVDAVAGLIDQVRSKGRVMSLDSQEQFIGEINYNHNCLVWLGNGDLVLVMITKEKADEAMDVLKKIFNLLPESKKQLAWFELTGSYEISRLLKEKKLL